MKKEFEALFKTIEELKTKISELEQEEQNRAELRQQTKTEFYAIVKKYYDAEEKINERMRKAEEENIKNREEIKILMRKQIEAEETGREFEGAERLEKLKAEVAAYSLKIETIEQLRKEVVVSVAEQEKISELRSEESRSGGRVRSLRDAVSLILGKLRDENCLQCLASFEYVPGREQFMYDEFKEFAEMRMEKQKWEL